MFLNISRFLLIFSAFLVPIYLDYGILFPFTFSKTFIFSLLVLLVGVFLVIEYGTNKESRFELTSEIKSLLKQPLFLSVNIFFFLIIVSTIFATDRYFAFWGTIERGDGLLGLTILYSYFIFLSISFERKHWIWLFKTTIASSIILIFQGLQDIFSGVDRIDASLGNPSWLAGYLLFSITSALIVFNQSKDNIWKGLAIFVVTLSLIEIFFTETRGTILGVLFGGLSVMVFYVFQKNEIRWKNFNVKKIFTRLLVLGAIFSVIFIVTINSNFWQKIPGISRVADISLEDATTKSRLLVWDMSLKAVNPKDQPKEFLIGWGPENSFFGLDKYYNSYMYRYDGGYVDRSHNKFLDVLVMGGILGLLAYLAIWFFFFRNILREKTFESVTVLFFAVSFLVHIIFLFDQIPTSICLYTLLAFSLSWKGFEKADDKKHDVNFVFTSFIILLVLLNAFMFFRGTLIGYVQASKYMTIIRSKDVSFIKDNISKAFYPFSMSQNEIGEELMRNVQVMYGNRKSLTPAQKEDLEKLFEITINRAEEYMTIRPKDYRFLSAVSNLYYQRAITLNDIESIKIGEKYLRDVIAYVPNRYTLQRALAVNMINQDRYEEAEDILNNLLDRHDDIPALYYDYGYLKFLGKDFNKAFDFIEKSLDMDNELFRKEGYAENTMIYGVLLEDAYKKRDKEKFIIIAERLKLNEYHASDSLDILIDQIEKGIWPPVDFK